MQDPRIDALANVLVNYSTAIKPGQLVGITAPVVATPLIKAIYHYVLKVGAHPYAIPSIPELTEMFFREANDEQLQHVPVIRSLMVDQFDSIFYIGAPENTRSLSNTDPAKLALYSSAQRDVTARHVARLTGGERRDVITMYPTQAYAQEAEMSLSEYEEFFFRACRTEEADPVAAWQEQSKRQQHIVDYLKGKKQLRVQSPDCDLTLNIEGRGFINADGKVNFPDGEVFTSPVENGTNGHIRYTYPAVFQNREVDDVQLWFEQGRVVKAIAGKNQEFLDKMLDMDEGARRYGEFAIGTNPGITQFTKNTLLDEKISGTIHAALGQSFAAIGGQNNSALHWDMVTDMTQGTITADDEVIYRNGEFVI